MLDDRGRHDHRNRRTAAPFHVTRPAAGRSHHRASFSVRSRASRSCSSSRCIWYALLCYAIAGLAGMVWKFVVSTIAVNHAVFCINSLAHIWGSRRYDTPDTARNNALLAALTLGEGSNV